MHTRPICNERYILYGYIQGDGQTTKLLSNNHSGIQINIGKNDQEIYELFKDCKYTRDKNGLGIYCMDIKNELLEFGFDPVQLPERKFPKGYEFLSVEDKASFLQGCFSANGCVVGKTRVQYKSTCKVFIEQLMSTLEKDFGIIAYYTTNKRKKNKFKNGEYNLDFQRYASKVMLITQTYRCYQNSSFFLLIQTTVRNLS